MPLPSGQYIRIGGTAFSSAGFSVGDVIVVSGSTNNNGIYTINDITSNSTYEYLGLSGPQIEEEDGSGVTVENITVGGNKIVCIGDEDSGSIGIWSYNDATTVTGAGSVLNSPEVGTSGWSHSSMYPLINGSNAQYIFTPGQSALRICDTNIGNNSLIKHFGYINRIDFANRHGGIFAGFYEHSNILSKPVTGGYINYNYSDQRAYGLNSDESTTIKADFHLRRSLGGVASGEYSQGIGNYAAITNRTKNNVDILSTEEILYLEDASDLAKVPLDAVIGIINTPRLNVDTVEHITSARDRDFESGIVGTGNWVEYGGNGGGISVSGNVLQVTTTTTNAREGAELPIAHIDGDSNNYPIEQGKSYTVSVSLKQNSGPLTPFNISLGGLVSDSFTITSSHTTYTKEIFTTNNTGNLIIFNTSASAGVFEIENVSVKETVSFSSERMLVRTIDKSNYSMRVYRGYANSTASAIEWDKNNKYLVQYGCGFNFKAIQGSAGSGTYLSGSYEFAQSFVYDGNQESLLRTPSNFSWSTSETANRITVTTDSVAIKIQVYAFSPYNGRVTGGRIYIREVDSNESWSLFVDIDIVRGCRTSIDGEFKRWVNGEVANYIPSGCFYSGTDSAPLISKGLQLDKYADINNYYPEIKRNSIGLLGESYQASVTGGERAWIGNVKLQQDTGSIERFGDRIMYSEFGKYDVFPDLNYFTASKGDAEDITALQYFGDRLLIFKNRTLHIWNVGSTEPFNWMPERTVEYGGIENHFSVTNTPYGVVWANKTGFYFYDGNQVIDLTENKIKDIQSSYHGVPPSWDEFISSSTSLQRPMVMYSPKEKQVYILRDPLGGSNSNQCYIYNFMTRGWVYNTSIFTAAAKYTNSITDWNGNVVIAHDTFSSPTTSYLGNAIQIASAYSTDERNSGANNKDFAGAGNWGIYDPNSTGFSSPTVGSGAIKFTGTQMGSNTHKKEGIALPHARIAGIVTKKHYIVSATLSCDASMAGVPFFIEMWEASAPIGEINTTPNEYSVVLVAASASDLRIYKMSSGASVDNGNREVTIDNVSVKEAGIQLNQEDHGFRFNDLLKIDNEWFRVKSINPNDTEYVEVEGAKFSTASADHNINTNVGRPTATFLQISSTSVATGSPSFITKDLDFDKPGVVKKIYKMYITYKNSGSQLTNPISVAVDGNRIWAQANITSGQSINNTAGAAITPTLTGVFAGSITSWNVATFSFDKPLNCQSLSIYFNRAADANGISINDITFEFKSINRRVS